MSHRTRVPAELLGQLREAARLRVQQALNALDQIPGDREEFGPPPGRPEPDEFRVPHTEVTPDLARRACWYFAKGEPVEGADVLVARVPELARELKRCRRTAADPIRRLDVLRSLTLAVAMAVPALARRGRYRRAVKLAELHRRLALAGPFTDVPGAGGTRVPDGSEMPTVRFLLIAPVSWSLVGYAPER